MSNIAPVKKQLTAYLNSTYGLTIGIYDGEGTIDVASRYSDVQIRLFTRGDSKEPIEDYKISTGDIEIFDTNKISLNIAEPELESFDRFVLYYELRVFFADESVQT